MDSTQGGEVVTAAGTEPPRFRSVDHPVAGCLNFVISRYVADTWGRATSIRVRQSCVRAGRLCVRLQQPRRRRARRRLLIYIPDCSKALFHLVKGVLLLPIASREKTNRSGNETGKRTMSDAKYFQTTKRGEIHELKEELHTNDKAKQKEAVKKVIAAMTVGKDVSMLFPDVCNCMQTPNIELKKLVYLYLINYAKSQPDLAIMAVNTFVKDASDGNPLIRALAVRTMGCIRVQQITEYLTSPLLKCLRDEDPYVRKTAAICVVKLYDINPELVQEQGFLELVVGLVSDQNPSVVANAVACLSEIAEASGHQNIFGLAPGSLPKLLAALNECSEWGQVHILDAISLFHTDDAKIAESTIERVVPRLQHSNAAVVLSAAKVVLNNLLLITDPETIKLYTKKLAPPLVTLLSAEPEIQYVALRNIQLITQNRPMILANDIKVFFCRYNDPTYVKVEKVDVMIMLASERNVEQVLMELKEYAYAEVDVDFVRKAVRAIGRCALKIESSAERCVAVLVDLIQTKVAYVVQEAIVVIKDIFRKYPNKYESVIGTLCENLESLEEPEAKAALIWIIGQYAERIDNSQELLEAFIEEFADLDVEVQLQLLTATVKLFLKKPANSQGTVKEILQLATTKSTNPDLRDRGYIYWRLLSSDPEKARQVVLGEHATVQYDSQRLDNALLETLLKQVSSLASVYHKPPQSFLVDSGRQAVTLASSPGGDTKGWGGAPQVVSAGGTASAADSLDVLDLVGGGGGASHKPAVVDDLLDLLGDIGGGGGGGPPVTMQGGRGGGVIDLMGGLSIEDGMGGGGSGDFGGAGGTGASASSKPLKTLLTGDKGGGMAINGVVNRRGGKVFYDFEFQNTGAGELSGIAIQFNKNFLGLTNAAPLQVMLLAICAHTRTHRHIHNHLHTHTHTHTHTSTHTHTHTHAHAHTHTHTRTRTHTLTRTHKNSFTLICICIYIC